MRLFSLALLLAVALAAPAPRAQALQKISPIVECVGQAPDGSFFAWFGYFNRNPFAVTVPRGASAAAANRFASADDRGQPEAFLDGRRRFVFRVAYPAGTETWLLRAPGTAQGTATAGTTPTGACAWDSFTDLSLVAAVDDPAPEVGQTVTATVRLVVGGTVGTRETRVDVGPVPAGVTLLGGTTAQGLFDAATGEWWLRGDWMEPGTEAALTLQFRVDALGAVAVPAEVTTTETWDIDSTPGNGETGAGEDDTATIAITPSPGSGGQDGGLESNGRLASLLARRAVERSRRAPEAPVRLAEAGPLAVARGAALDLRRIVPTVGPHGTEAVVATPADLPEITNATAVLGADYLQPDGDRAGVVLAVLTPAGQLYDHTKAICDRVKGSRLEGVTTVGIGPAEFVLLHVTRPDGSAEYAVSFTAVPTAPGAYTVDSRFRADEYAATPSAGETLTVQVWGGTPDVAVGLAERVLAALGAEAELDYRNWGHLAPRPPVLFVRGGAYAAGALTLDVANATGQPQALRLAGSRAPTEEGVREPFEAAAAVPAGGGTVVVETGPLFDVGFVVEAAGFTADDLYLADGPWTYTSGHGSDALDFGVEAAAGGAASPGVRPLERAAHLSGVAQEWAGLFRTLVPGARPVDLSAYDAVAFTASGHGRVQVVLESGAPGPAPSAFVDLTDTPQPVRLRFADFAGGDGPLDPSRVALVAFYTYADGGVPTPFAVDVRDVRFEAPGVAATEAPPLALALGVSPNPSRGEASVRIVLPAAADVAVDVFDVLGRRVAVLAEGHRAAGPHAFMLGRGLAPGAYVVRLRAGGAVLVLTVTRL